MGPPRRDGGSAQFRLLRSAAARSAGMPRLGRAGPDGGRGERILTPPTDLCAAQALSCGIWLTSDRACPHVCREEKMNADRMGNSALRETRSYKATPGPLDHEGGGTCSYSHAHGRLD